MFFITMIVASAGLLYVVDSSQAAAEEKLLEEIVRKARARAKKAESAIDDAVAEA